MTKGVDIYTDFGLRKIRDAAVSNAQVRIKYIALGDGNGTAYHPSSGQTGLRRQLLQIEVESQYPVGNNLFYVKGAVPPGSPAIIVREMAFKDASGDTIAIWAGLDVGEDRRTGPYEYLIRHMMDFRAVADGLVIVDAPGDDLITFMVASLRNHVSQARAIFEIQQTLRGAA